MTGFLRSLAARRAPPAIPSAAASAPADITQANIRRLVAEMAWYGILIGTTVNFIQVYIVRLGASSLLLGAVTYGPALVSLLWQLPAGRFITQAGHRMRWVVGSLLTHRVLYLLIALLPFLLTGRLVEATVLLVILQAFPLAIANTSFLSMLADVLPSHRTTQVVGWRMAGLGITSTISTLLVGRMLQRVVFPLNYQVSFFIGFSASLVSAWLISRIVVKDPPPAGKTQGALLGNVGAALRRRGFGLFLVIACLTHLVIGIISPLLPLYWVHGLDATDGQISIIITAASAAQVVGALSMQRIVRRIGQVWALGLAALGYAMYPLLTSISPSIWWLVPWAMLAGFMIAGLYTNLFSNLVSLSPEHGRTEYVSLYNLALFAGLFVGPVIGGLLAEVPGGVVLGLRLAALVGVACFALVVANRRLLTRAAHNEMA
jgi:MFS family permease